MGTLKDLVKTEEQENENQNHRKSEARKPWRMNCLTRSMEGEGGSGRWGFSEWWTSRSYKGEAPGFLGWEGGIGAVLSGGGGCLCLWSVTFL